MLVTTVMTPIAECVAPDTSLRDAADKMRNFGVCCLPVKEGSELIGMISDNDIARRAVADGRDPSTTPVANVMSEVAAWCFIDQDTDDAMHLMRDKRTRHLVVLDYEDHTVGILVIDDLWRRACETLPIEETIAALDEYWGWSRRRW